MPLQDLTPQLRTRLSRMEKAVGWFVLIASLLLLVGLAYYVYATAERKGWFVTKAKYFAFVDTASGLHVGDPVMLMGFDAGAITAIKPMAADQPYYRVYLEFELRGDNIGYMWTDGSVAKVVIADLLGKRVLEVTKGTNGYPTYTFRPLQRLSIDDAKPLWSSGNWWFGQEIFDSNGSKLLAKPYQPLTNVSVEVVAAAGYSNLVVLDGDEKQKRKVMTGIWNDSANRYEPWAGTNKPYWLPTDEAPAVTERLEALVAQVEHALPNVLSLTNSVQTVLSNSAVLTSNLNIVAINARPMVTNLALLSAHLDHPGALGDLLIPTNLASQLGGTLGKTDATLDAVSTNLTALATGLEQSLVNLSLITSNLNGQVQANTNLLKGLSDAVIHADEFVQGLKHHWLLRSAFKTKPSNPPPAHLSVPLRSPKNGE